MAKDNLSKLYSQISPETSRRSIAKMSEIAASAQKVFDKLASAHPEMGAGVCLPIARNIVSRICSICYDPDKADREVNRELLELIAPMVTMHYDAYQRNILDNIEECLVSDEKKQ